MRLLIDRSFAFPYLTSIPVPKAVDDNSPLTLRKFPKPRRKALPSGFSCAEQRKRAKHFIKDRRFDPIVKLVAGRFSYRNVVNTEISTQKLCSPFKCADGKSQGPRYAIFFFAAFCEPQAYDAKKIIGQLEAQRYPSSAKAIGQVALNFDD